MVAGEAAVGGVEKRGVPVTIIVCDRNQSWAETAGPRIALLQCWDRTRAVFVDHAEYCLH